MSKSSCPWCNHSNITIEGRNHWCNYCGYEWQSKPTLFDRITQSEETLAPHFVYHVTSFLDGLDKPKKIWYSTLINNQYYNTEPEAKIATVARLKEAGK